MEKEDEIEVIKKREELEQLLLFWHVSTTQ